MLLMSSFGWRPKDIKVQKDGNVGVALESPLWVLPMRFRRSSPLLMVWLQQKIRSKQPHTLNSLMIKLVGGIWDKGEGRLQRVKKKVFKWIFAYLFSFTFPSLYSWRCLDIYSSILYNGRMKKCHQYVICTNGIEALTSVGRIGSIMSLLVRQNLDTVQVGSSTWLDLLLGHRSLSILNFDFGEDRVKIRIFVTPVFQG